MLEGKKVLVTGLTGRIGQAVAVRFAPICDMWGLARYSREGSRAEAEAIGVRPVQGDFANGDLGDLPADFDYVLHIAADVYGATAEAMMRSNSDGIAHLMKHCRTATAFLHVSTCGVYRQEDDPWAVYTEESDVGGGGRYGSQYVPTKLAGEGAARAGALLLDLPTIICRQNVQYGGPHVRPGLIDRQLSIFVETGEVPIATDGDKVMAPIHEDDICDLIEPSLRAASVPATIVNWCGDEWVEWKEIFEFAGALIGKTPKFVPTEAFTLPSCAPDPTKRQLIAGPVKVKWKEGVRRVLALRYPELVLAEV